MYKLVRENNSPRASWEVIKVGRMHDVISLSKYRLYLKKLYIFVGNIMKKIQKVGSQRLLF